MNGKFESKSLERLDLSCNRLRIAPKLSGTPLLRVLDLSYNHLRDLSPIREVGEKGGLQHLIQLDLRHNFIENPIAVQCLKPLRALKRLRFCSQAEFKARQKTKIHNSIVSRPGYRAAVRVAIPWLNILDETPLRRPEALSQITLRVDGVALRRFYAVKTSTAPPTLPRSETKENLVPQSDEFRKVRERLEQISKERDELRDQVSSLEESNRVKKEEVKKEEVKKEEAKEEKQEQHNHQEEIEKLKSKIETLQMSLEQQQQENTRLEQEKTRSREERDAIFEEVTRLRKERVVDSCKTQALIVAVRSVFRMYPSNTHY